MIDDDALRQLVITEGATVRDAMLAIDQGTVEIALVVDGAGRLVAAVSDGDIRRALLGGTQLDDPVMPHASRDPKTTGPESSRAQILDQMRAQHISQVPIIDADGRLVGLHVMRELLGGQRRPNAAVIMAGGRGTRLGSLTETIPKPMLKVAGRPILERLVLHLVGSGIRSLFLSVNYLAQVIEDHFGDGEDYGCEIRYLREDPDRPLGTAGSLALIDPDSPARKAPLLVMNGDLVTDFSVPDLLASHASSDAVATVALGDYDHRVPFGVVDVREGRVHRLVEKPVQTWPINAGIYVLDPSLIDRVSAEREYHVTALIDDCLRREEPVNAWELLTEWHDVGRPTQLQQARGQL